MDDRNSSFDPPSQGFCIGCGDPTNHPDEPLCLGCALAGEPLPCAQDTLDHALESEVRS